MYDRVRAERFTDQAINVLDLAREEAERFQHSSIGVEHLLLGLVREEDGVAATALANLGIELNAARSAIKVVMGHGDRPVSGEITMTSRAKKVVERAIDEARNLNHRYIGTEHLLLSLVSEGEGIATGLLESLGTDLERLRTLTIQEFGQLSQSGTLNAEFDSDTEGPDPPPSNEREALGIYIWSQEASDNLGKVAADAAKAAQKNPGQWVNPLKSYLLSRIRYAQTPSQIRQFFLEAILDEKTFKEKIQEYSDGYFQIDYSKMNMLLIRVPESVAISDLKESWYEEIYKIEDERYGQVIRLIKRLGRLETDKIRAIKSRRCFTELSSLPGLKRFVSADRRFPVSVLYPRELGFVYYFSDERNLYVDWTVPNGSLGISRENFGMTAQNGNRGTSLVLQGKENISHFMLDDFAQREFKALIAGIDQDLHKPWLENKIVGAKEQSIEAKRLVWQTPSGQYGGEWVFFLRARQAGMWSLYTNFKPRVLYVLPELWTIYNSFLGEEDFNMFLSSFRLLNVDFFRSLPARP